MQLADRCVRDCRGKPTAIPMVIATRSWGLV